MLGTCTGVDRGGLCCLEPGPVLDRSCAVTWSWVGLMGGVGVEGAEPGASGGDNDGGGAVKKDGGRRLGKL